MKDGYWLVGFQYEFTGTLYSLGQIPRCKTAMLKHLKPDDKLLVAGVGHGTEAIEAAQMGVDVTAVDLSETMLKQMQKRVDKTPVNKPIRMIHDDILNINETDTYEMVIANFFLNVFGVDQIKSVVRHLATLVKPGGYLVVGDFMFPEEGYKGIFQKLNWYLASFIYSRFTESVLHPVHDYPSLMEECGFKIEEIQKYKILNTDFYWSILGKR